MKPLAFDFIKYIYVYVEYFSNYKVLLIDNQMAAIFFLALILRLLESNSFIRLETNEIVF